MNINKQGTNSSGWWNRKIWVSGAGMKPEVYQRLHFMAWLLVVTDYFNRILYIYIYINNTFHKWGNKCL